MYDQSVFSNSGIPSEFGLSEPASAFSTLPDQNSPWLATDPYGIDLAANPAQPSSGAQFGMDDQVMSRISGLLAQIAQLLPAAGGTGQAAAGDTAYPAGANQTQPCRTFQAASTGDPHDSFSATSNTGANADTHWDNMQSHADLLSSPSFQGGIRVSSAVTAPQANGKTMNGQIDVRLDHGRDDVRMTADGTASIEQNGQWTTLGSGASAVFADGATVNDVNGTLQLQDQNSSGGQISLQLSSNGQGGVDLQSSGRDVRLGGYLAQTPSPATALT